MRSSKQFDHAIGATKETWPGGAARRRRGVSAIEFAIALPLLMLLALGCVDFGRAMHAYITVTNAARAGAEYGGMRNFEEHSRAAWESQIQSAVNDELSGWDDFDAGSLTIDISTTPESDELFRVAVEVRCLYETMIDWPGLPHSLEISRRVEMRRSQ